MSKQRKKGTAAETAVVEWLKTNGFAFAERRAGNGVNDRGDVAGIPGVVLEVKNCARMELGKWLDELVVEMDNAGSAVGAVVHKRVRKGDPGEWYATMPLKTLAELIR